MEIGKTDDPWKELPDGFLDDSCSAPDSWKLD